MMNNRALAKLVRQYVEADRGWLAACDRAGEAMEGKPCPEGIVPCDWEQQVRDSFGFTKHYEAEGVAGAALATEIEGRYRWVLTPEFLIVCDPELPKAFHYFDRSAGLEIPPG